MASKDLHADGAEGLKRIERFLKILTWQMVVLLLILVYIAIRPQAGRYQFLVQGEDAGLFDTAYGQARFNQNGQRDPRTVQDLAESLGVRRRPPGRAVKGHYVEAGLPSRLERLA